MSIRVSPRVDYSIQIISISGLLISLYAIYVESQSRSSNISQKTHFCDISENISCSKVFQSEYGKIFSYLGIISIDSLFNMPNAVYGMVFYVLVWILSRLLILFESEVVYDVLLLLSVLSVVLSSYLGFILFHILENLCIVCISTHMLNILLFAVLTRIGWTEPSRKI